MNSAANDPHHSLFRYRNHAKMVTDNVTPAGIILQTPFCGYYISCRFFKQFIPINRMPKQKKIGNIDAETKLHDVQASSVWMDVNNVLVDVGRNTFRSAFMTRLPQTENR